MRNVADSVGIQTTFVSDYSLTQSDFLLYQANGGGLSTFDMDMDGLCDVYIVQSGGTPDKESSSRPNQLFRNLGPQQATYQFEEVSSECGANGRGYGQGACVGDLNQDGFPDLVVGNFGRNEVYINQGDGTFRRCDASVNDRNQWTSSVAIADLNGDTLPEIVTANYVDDPTVRTKRCVGLKIDCHPRRFLPAADYIYASRGDGTFHTDPSLSDIAEKPNYSLGCAVTNFDGKHGNDLFFSVDGGLNHYWQSNEKPTVSSKYVLKENAVAAGCSVGGNGRRQACMGIGVGDFDHSGTPDITITNFANDPGNLFLQSANGLFSDVADRFGLAQQTEPLLGFGTQAIDFDNDRWLDIAILNGHIYDARSTGTAFRMPAMLLRRGPEGFENQVASPSSYWAKKTLGRSLSAFDFNRDGRQDLIANHLDQPIAVLQNESTSGKWLQVQLAGTTCERDAIGARVAVTLNTDITNPNPPNVLTAWRVSGGYMNSNEPVIHFGLGEATKVDLEIRWPTGDVQRLKKLTVNQRVLVVQGLNDAWVQY